MDSKKSLYGLCCVLAAAALLWASFAALSPAEAFWTTDGGNKFIQMESFELHGSPAIAYPASGIDPEFRFFPLSGHHFLKSDGKILSFYPPYFPLLSLPFHKLFGFRGIYIIPAAAALLCLAACWGIAGALGLKGWRRTLSVAALAFATPLLFYGAAFWEHSCAMLLSSLAALLMASSAPEEGAGRRLAPLTAGLLLGLSCALREESYVFIAAAFAALAWTGQWRRMAPLAAGCAAAIVPLWTFQFLQYGSPWGIHASVYEGMAGGRTVFQAFQDFAGNVHFYLLKFGNEGWPTTLLSLLFALSLLIGLFWKGSAKRFELPLAALALCLALSAFLLFKFLRCPDPVIGTAFAQALLPGTPFLIVLLLWARPLLSSADPSRRFVSSLCLVYAALACVFLNRADVGVIWGARHFLPLFPLLTPLCVLAFNGLFESCPSKASKTALSFLAASLLALGVGLQLFGLRLLSVKLEASSLLRAELAKREGQGPIVSDIFWLPEEMGTLYHKIPMMQVGDSTRLEEAVALLKAAGARKFTLVLSAKPQFRKIGQDDTLRSLKSMKVEPGPQIAHPEAEFMRCQIFSCEIPQ